MNNIPQISDAEWQVMRILWENSPMTAMEVIKQLEETKNWKPKTIKTLLRRLVDKKAITYTVEGRTYCYRTLVKENECIRAETESFLEKVFNGSLNLLVESFVREKRLTDEELQNLKKILEENEK
jgi:BlaI family penicillinase repressor